jgi:hypothetical protein
MYHLNRIWPVWASAWSVPSMRASPPVNRVGVAIPGSVGYDSTPGSELRRDA